MSWSERRRRQECIQVRVTQAEKDKIYILAKQAGFDSANAYMRWRALAKSPAEIREESDD